MDLNYLRRLLKIFDESSAVELRIEEEGINLRIAKQSSGGTSVQALPSVYQVQPALQQPSSAAPVAPAVAAEPARQEEAPPAPVIEENLHTIVCPIVGTFYRASSPDAEPFTQVGDRVSAGSPLCIVEAMKLMNEIESDVTGTVVKVLVENAKPVEYGQPLFSIRLD